MIELLFAVAIIGLLVAMAFPTYKIFKEEARVSRAMAEIRGIEQQISAYSLERGILPASLDQLAVNVPNDPWGNPYVYENIGELGRPPLKDYAVAPYNSDFDLYSKGVNGNSEQVITVESPISHDDVLRTNDGSWVGLRK